MIDLSNITVNDILNDTIEEKVIQPKEEPTKETPVEEPEVKEQEDATEETTETTEEQQEESIINTLKTHFGYEVEGDFTEDIEGLKTFTSEIAKKMALSELEEVFKLVPDAGEYLQYRMNGGDPQKFFDVNFSEPDYSKFELTEDNVGVSKEIIRVFLKKQDYTENEIIETIADYEDTGILYKQANKILPKLIKFQQDEKEGFKKRQQEELLKQEEAAKKEWQLIENTITSGKLGNIAIPESEKSKFFEWMAIPVQDGKSQRMIDRESIGVENMLALEYLLYKKMDISKLATIKNTTKETLELKNLLNKKGNVTKNAQTSVKKQNHSFRLADFI